MAMAGAAVAAAHGVTADQRAQHIKQLTDKSRDRLNKELKKETERQKWPKARMFLYNLVGSHWFEVACGFIILVNMGLVVIETDAGVGDEEAPAWIRVVTLLLLSIYTAELIAKLYVHRLDFFKEMWNCLDFLIVGVDLLFLMISLFINMPSVAILRVFRLVRLARAFKAAKSFRELNSLLRACTCALKAIFWGMVMMILTLTVWGILAVQLIHPINESIHNNKPWLYEGCERCPRAYSTVFDSALTFWKQLVAGDSWGTLCEPIIEEAPWTAMFFMLVLVTVNLTMLNCILAVVVEAGAAAAAADLHDKAMQHEKMVAQAEGKLIDLCKMLDADGSGNLTIQEFLKGFHENEEFRQCLELMNVTEADMTMIFNICDEDDSGEVDYREFVDQFRRIKHSGEQMLLHYVTDVRHVVRNIRPECLKGKKKENQGEEKMQQEKEGAQASEKQEIKKPSPREEDLQQAAYTSEGIVAPKDLPPALAEILTKNGPDKFQEEKPDDGAGVSDMMEAYPKEKVERMWQMNDDLVNIMTDLADQSKVQTQLLNVLVQRATSSSAEGGRDGQPVASGATGASSSQEASAAPAGAARADPDVVQLVPVGPPTTAPSKRSEGNRCCVAGVRVV